VVEDPDRFLLGQQELPWLDDPFVDQTEGPRSPTPRWARILASASPRRVRREPPAVVASFPAPRSRTRCRDHSVLRCLLL
jgi:hypothetical protein